MSRALTVLALTVLVAASPALAASSAQTKTACLDPASVTLCVTASMTLDLECTAAADGAHALCQALFTWTTTGQSTLLLPGEAVHAASAILEWCRPGSFCQGYGVGFLIEGCNFGPLAPNCTDTGSYNLYPGPIPLEPGQCMPVTLSGFARADGYLVNPSLTFGHALVTAEVSDSTGTTFCM